MLALFDDYIVYRFRNSTRFAFYTLMPCIVTIADIPMRDDDRQKKKKMRTARQKKKKNRIKWNAQKNSFDA